MCISSAASASANPRPTCCCLQSATATAPARRSSTAIRRARRRSIRWCRPWCSPISWSAPPSSPCCSPWRSRSTRSAAPSIPSGSGLSSGTSDRAAAMNALAPVLIALPLAAAALLLAIGPKLRNRVPDTVALIVALACAALTAVLARAALGGPLVEWMGGWRPREGVAIGIAVVVDPAGGGLAVMICLLFAASFVFAWGYFAEVGVRFHVLMLLFLAGMVGLCLAGDLFNMFVFFELMSVAAFSLTAYRLEASDLEGAMNFTVTNTLGSFLILGGIGLIYGRTGALNFAQLGHAVASLGGDPLVAASFVMLALGFLIKGAIVPFHFWLADAHAVAPSPVSVIFFVATVALGVFAVARLFWTVFAFDPALAAPARIILVDFGAATTLIGAIACLGQRHLKRLLAFSTIAHTGIQLIGIGLMKQAALAGAFLYILGHGLVKGALFMLAGILLAICAGIDEIALRGKGRRLPLTGAAFAVAGLLLAGAPIGAADTGLAAIDHAAREAGQGWLAAVLLAGSALTGAAVLRSGGRIFLGWGPTPG